MGFGGIRWLRSWPGCFPAGSADLLWRSLFDSHGAEQIAERVVALGFVNARLSMWRDRWARWLLAGAESWRCPEVAAAWDEVAAPWWIDDADLLALRSLTYESDG